MRQLLLAASLLVPFTTIAAQAPAKGGLPAGWHARADDNGDLTKVAFTPMKPGWHVTTGPVSAVMFHPGMTGNGKYSAQMSVYFFPPKSDHQEAYGLVVGGKDLAGAGQEYTYFLARNDGKFSVKRRVGDATTTIVPWTAAPSIKLWAAGGPNALNALRVEAGTDSVTFKINDVAVATRSRKEVPVDGVVGMRVNHFLDLHVRDLTVTSAR